MSAEEFRVAWKRVAKQLGTDYTRAFEALPEGDREVVTAVLAGKAPSAIDNERGAHGKSLLTIRAALRRLNQLAGNVLEDPPSRWRPSRARVAALRSVMRRLGGLHACTGAIDDPVDRQLVVALRDSDPPHAESLPPGCTQPELNRRLTELIAQLTRLALELEHTAPDPAALYRVLDQNPITVVRVIEQGIPTQWRLVGRNGAQLTLERSGVQRIISASGVRSVLAHNTYEDGRRQQIAVITLRS